MATIGKKVIGGKGRFSNPGPVTYKAGAALTPGQLVMAGSGGTAGTVIPATANALGVIGAAVTSALPAGTANTYTDPSGFPGLAPDMPDGDVAVERHGARYLLASGTFNFGDFVKAAALGTVVKWDPAADQAISQVGQCIDPDGATSGAAVLIDLNIQG